MAKTIKDILDGRYFASTDIIYFSDNGLSGAKNEMYPYKIIRSGNGNAVDKNIFILDMVEVRKFMSYQKNSRETFYAKMIDNIDAYKDRPDLMDENRQELYIAWWAMNDQLKTMVEKIKNEGGMVVVPNVEYFKAQLSNPRVNYTSLRIEFAAVLDECLAHNYMEAEKINATKFDEAQKIKPSQEYRAYMGRVIENKSKGKGKS